MKPIPTMHESLFDLHEVFFSATDRQGVIRSGNRVFVKVAKYSKQELMGAPHNIIRHPDMPRIVFKVLWDYLHQGRSIAAYVKNMAKDGSFYWVFATVFPVEDGYLSVRLKPSSPLLGLIPDLYRQTLEVEKSEGMDASLRVILDALKEKGINSYDEFMSAALAAELKIVRGAIQAEEARAGLHHEISSEPLVADLERASMRAREARDFFFKASEQMELHVATGKKIKEKSKFVADLAENVTLLSLNTSVAAKQLGQDAVSLGVIAEQFTRLTEKIGSSVTALHDAVERISASAFEMDFEIALSAIQTHMIRVFASELRADAARGALAQEEFAEFLRNGSSLVGRIEDSYRKTSERLKRFADEMSGFVKDVAGLQKVLMTLDLTKKTGVIEAARLGTNGEKFMIVFDEMMEMLEEASHELQESQQATHEAIRQASESARTQGHVEGVLRELRLLLTGELPARMKALQGAAPVPTTTQG